MGEPAEKAGQGNRGDRRGQGGARTKQVRPAPVSYACRFFPADLSAVTRRTSVRIPFGWQLRALQNKESAQLEEEK